MRSRRFSTGFVTATLALLSLPHHIVAQEVSAHPSGEFSHYTITDLGALENGTNATATDMNQLGWIAGASNLVAGGPQHAFLWYGRGRLRDLGTLDGPNCPMCNSAADGPNLFGEAAVGSEIAEPDPDGEDFCAFGTHSKCRATVWRNGRLHVLRNLPGGRNANSFEINDLGEVVGFAETGIRDSTCATATPFQVHRFEAVRWERNGNIVELPPLRKLGDTVSFSFGNNDLGQVVGSSGTCATQGLPPGNVNGLHAVLWERDGSPTYLGTLGNSAHTSHNAASSVNNRGEVVGTSEFTDGTVHSFLWTKTKGMQDIGTLPGAFLTVAACCRTINNRGQVVGFSIDDSGMRAFIWQKNKIKDLNTLIPANSPLYLLGAYSINDAGEIVGQGCVLPECTVLHVFRATPNN